MNIFARLWRALVVVPLNSFARWLEGNRSSQDLLAEMRESANAELTASYNDLKQSGGTVAEVERQLAIHETAYRKAQANLRRAVSRNADKATIAQMGELVKLRKNAVVEMEAALKMAQQAQLGGERQWERSSLQRDVQEATAVTNIALENFFKLTESAYDRQLAAMGRIQDGRVVDHSDELARRAAIARGRSDSAGRMAAQAAGEVEGDDAAYVDDETAAILREAYQEAGRDVPSEFEDQGFSGEDVAALKDD